MDWISLVKKEYECLKAQRKEQIIQIWNNNKATCQPSNQNRCAKWVDELKDGHEIMQTNICGNDKSDQAVDCQTKKFLVPAVTYTPPMIKWVPISRNFVTKDSEPPKCDDDKIDDSFVSSCDDHTPRGRTDLIDDEMFVNLVRKLMPYQRSLMSASYSREEEQTPDAIIFQSISSYFNGPYTADKYAKLTESNCKFVPSNPNVDEPMKAPLERDQSLRSYRKYFCPRCCLYMCPLHPPAENIGDNTVNDRKYKGKELEPFQKPCSDTCYWAAKIGDDADEEKENLNPACDEYGNKSVTRKMAPQLTLAESVTDDHNLVEISNSNSSENRSFVNISPSDLVVMSENTFDEILEQDLLTESMNSTAELDIPQTPSTATETMDSNGASNHENEWTCSDQTMFLVLLNVFPYNCCAIAKTMRKSCEQVYKKMQSTDPPARIGMTKSPVRKESGKCSGNLQKHLEKTYSPCNHPSEPCNKSAKCACASCEKFCSCGPECQKRIAKCTCKGGCTTLKCICHYGQRECDPELCKCAIDVCKNKCIQIGREKKLRVIPSPIHGWGVAVSESCEKSDFIAEYKGEIISNKECERRAKKYARSCSYLFSLNGDSVIDAMFYGNKLRFLNFSKEPNCCCRVMMVNGDHRIGVYAARAIAAGEELTIDYFTYDPTVNEKKK